MSNLDSLFKKAGQTADKKEEPKAESPPETAITEAAPKKSGGFGGLKLAQIGVKKDVQKKAEGMAPTDKETAEAADTADAGNDSQADLDTGPGDFSASDKLPATAPVRDLSESAEPRVKNFLALLDSMHGLTPEPQLASDAIKNIMVELSADKELSKHIADEDIRVIVRTMRENMGIAKVAKAETKAKRGRSKKADDQMMADLKSLGMDLDLDS